MITSPLLSTLTLPAISDAYTNLARVVNNPSAGVSEMSKIIRADPALAVGVLRLANTAAAGRRDVVDVSVAVTYLGAQKVMDFVLTASMKHLFSGAVGAAAYWTHSVRVASYAQAIAELRMPEVNPEHAFTAGVLHDLGMLAMTVHYSAKYTDIAAHYHGIDLLHRETLAFGFDHPELGAALARAWNVPEPYCTAIACHHGDGLAEIHDPLVANLAKAVAMGDQLGTWPAGEVNQWMQSALNIPDNDWVDLHARAAEIQRQTRALFQ